MKATMVADSINPNGHRISTMQVTMPRIILAEFNTHRMFSRNSASSRAIPFKKVLDTVKNVPFIPLKWQKDHKGMQGTEYFGTELFSKNLPPLWRVESMDIDSITDMDERDWSHTIGDIVESRFKAYEEVLNEEWLFYRDEIAECAERLHSLGVTKQLCNRLLEPFLYHTVLVTATEYENFFSLRVDPAAEIHMQHVAELMLNCLNASDPKALQSGDWHLPYGDAALPNELIPLARERGATEMDLRIAIAVARCAQVSYTVVGEEGKPMDYTKLIALHDRLLKMGHMSPFEHVARCMNGDEYDCYNNGLAKNYGYDGGLAFPDEAKGWCGNFRGWIQYRKLLPNENRSDNRLKKYHGQNERHGGRS